MGFYILQKSKTQVMISENNSTDHPKFGLGLFGLQGRRSTTRLISHLAESPKSSLSNQKKRYRKRKEGREEIQWEGKEPDNGIVAARNRAVDGRCIN